MKTIFQTLVIALAVLIGTAGVMAADQALPNSKSVLAQDPANGIGTPLADLAIPGFGKELDKIRDTKWQYLAEYEDDVFSWYKLPDGRYAVVYKDTAKAAITDAAVYYIDLAFNAYDRIF